MILNVGDRSGKTYKVELPKEKEVLFIGKRIGDEIDGGEIGLAGYTLLITGGSDKSGFPMRKGVHGTAKEKLLLSGGVGYNPKRKGEKRRKTVRGEVVSDEIVQLNLKVVKEGPTKLEELLGKKEEKKGDSEEKK